MSWLSPEGWVSDKISVQDVSAEWRRGANYTNVSNYIVVTNIGGNTVKHSKSLFNFTISLTRNPKSAIIYIITPTVIFTIFNIISAWLPTGQGKGNYLI